jgi:hypothetical protein
VGQFYFGDLPGKVGQHSTGVDTEVPILALPGLLHLRVASRPRVLGRTRRRDDGCVHDGTRAQQQPPFFQQASDRIEDRFCRLREVHSRQDGAHGLPGLAIRNKPCQPFPEAVFSARKPLICRALSDSALAAVGSVERC